VWLKLRLSEQKPSLLELLQRATAGSSARSAVKAAIKRVKAKVQSHVTAVKTGNHILLKKFNAFVHYLDHKLAASSHFILYLQ
jgi:hypothetical protein